jgi:hypothetical protein
MLTFFWATKQNLLQKKICLILHLEVKMKEPSNIVLYANKVVPVLN